MSGRVLMKSSAGMYITRWACEQNRLAEIAFWWKGRKPERMRAVRAKPIEIPRGWHNTNLQVMRG